ncbi:hypothetical protein LEP1GSC170_1045 [Leptospira interrogans serovar Bataviae str. HAI135]|nr:hypothetical protein LEP1GSC170_1045 [Leptospira interrogans serovar Bataviae str. HAI135]
MKIDRTNIQCLSLADAQIEIFEGNINEKWLKLKLNGVTFSDQKSKKDGTIDLFFEGWQKISIREYTDSEKSWKSLNSIEPLSTISEEEYILDTYRITGFGSINTNWLEYIIIEPKISGQFE